MLGHKIYQVFSSQAETWTTLHGSLSKFSRLDLFDADKVFEEVDAQDFSTVERCLTELRPEIVINSVGVIKQKSDSDDIIKNLEVNSIFPHKVASLVREWGARFITFSTDCVFDGKKGNYEESDFSNARDLYGKSKSLGEVTGSNCLTLRTSIIGREICSEKSLVEWFLSNKGGRVKGFSNAIYSGFPTIVAAQILWDVCENHKKLEGLFHLSSEPINKFDLLKLIDSKLDLGIEIEKYEGFRVDRSLDSSRFQNETGFRPENWTTMVDQMFEDPTPYEDWKKLLKTN